MKLATKQRERLDTLRDLIGPAAKLYIHPMIQRDTRIHEAAHTVWSFIDRELMDAERDLVMCNTCGNEWTKDEYEEMRHVDASDGWCPSCGELGDVQEVE